MTRSPTICLLSCIALLFITNLVHAEPPTKEEAHKFNQAIVEANKKLFAAGGEWGQNAHLNDNVSPDADGLQKGYKNCQKVLAEVKAEMKGLKVPETKSAGEFYKLHQKFLDAQERSIKNELKDLTDVLSDPKLQDKEKKDKALEILKKANKSEQDLVVELQKAQETFAKEFGIDLSK